MEETLNYIKNNSQSIVERISKESIDVYSYIQDEYQKGDIIGNTVFQFVYRSFYRLDNAGLSPEFKKQYFVLLEENRLKKPNYMNVAIELSKYPTLREKESIQFSFVSKLFSTIDPSLAVYDSFVTKHFHFSYPQINLSPDKRIEIYLSQLEIIKRTYQEILTNGALRETIDLCRQTYDRDISDIKLLDFIFWTAGKKIKTDLKSDKRK